MTDSAKPVSAEQIKTLRERTGAGVMECKKALIEAEGSMEEAIQILRAKGASLSAEKSGRQANQGIIGSYVHGGKIGVLIEVNCETDFVARTDPFKVLVHELCLQIASMNPAYVSRESVPPEDISRVLEALHEEIAGVDDEAGPAMQQSHMENFYKERVLLDQPYVKDPSKTVQDLLHDAVASLREKIVIRRFTRFVLGEFLQAETASS